MTPSHNLDPAAAPHLHPTQGRLILILLQRAGVDVDGVLAETGFTALDLQKATRLVPMSVLRRLVLASPPDHRAGFGLALGELSPLTAQGPLGVAMATSADLDEALQTLGAFGGARARVVRFRYVVREDAGEVEVLETFDYGDMRMVVLESAALQVSKMMAAAIGRPPDGLEFQFPYRPPDWAALYADRFPGIVEFGGRSLRIRVPRSELSLRCVAADPAAHDAALRDCRREAEEPGAVSDADILPFVKNRLAIADDDYPGLEAMAKALAISPRTLIRRLRAAGASYRALVDEARAYRACRRLTHTNDPIDRIAADLGYADTSNFSRTFRRWRNMAPSQYRARRQQNAATE